MKFIVTWLTVFIVASTTGTLLPQWVIKWSGEETKLREAAPSCAVNHLFDSYYQLDAPPAADEQLMSEIQIKLEQAPEAQSLERQHMEPKDLTFRMSRKNIDPEQSKQWYLFSQEWEKNKQTMNLKQAWDLNYSGKGVTVAIVDQGINNNTEFENRLVIADYNITSGTTPTKSHGTNVAGVIGAARDNGVCGTGIAPEVTLLDIKMMPNSGSSSSNMEQEALRPHDGQSVDIFHNSWTATNIGTYLYKLTPVVREAISLGVNGGRNGKGSIYVFSAGNGGAVDGCAYDGYLNNRHVIVVTGVSKDLGKLGTGESCSAVMVTAYSSDRTAKENNPIVTPDGDNHGCTHTFGRSSAASPMVSGAIALALEANPRLQWRDVQHLLVKTSRPHLTFTPNDFITNDANITVSPTFGFGLLDIGNLVSTAKDWKNNTLKPEISCSIRWHGDRQLKKGNKQEWKFHFGVGQQCNVEKLERVEVTIVGKFKVRGQLKASLKSPMATLVTLLKGRPYDFFQSGLDLTVSAVSFWDEHPLGSWALMFEDLDNQKRNNGSLALVELKLYGQGNGRDMNKEITDSPRPTTTTTTPATTTQQPTPRPIITTEATCAPSAATTPKTCWKTVTCWYEKRWYTTCRIPCKDVSV